MLLKSSYKIAKWTSTYNNLITTIFSRIPMLISAIPNTT